MTHLLGKLWIKMKKQKKEENLSLLKEAWKDPKYKALIKLTLWFLFITILVFVARFCEGTKIEQKPQEKVIHKTKLETMKNFEYEIKINENQNITSIKGIYYSSINDFEILNTKENYTIKENIIYHKPSNTIVDQLFPIHLNSLFPPELNKYLISENIISEIQYQNNQIKKEYRILNWDIISTNIEQDITVYEDKNYITKIEMDLTNSIKTTHPNINHYDITIEYQNINQIKNYQTS